MKNSTANKTVAIDIRLPHATRIECGSKQALVIPPYVAKLNNADNTLLRVVDALGRLNGVCEVHITLPCELKECQSLELKALYRQMAERHHIFISVK